MLNTMITPVLTLDESRLSSYDPQDPADLSTLWSAFSKSAQMVEHGERLRNFSWRLWNRERLCWARNYPSAPTPQNTPSSPANSPVPQLSSSVESDSSTETEEDSVDSTVATSTASIAINNAQKQPKERHITPRDLRNMVHSIRQPREFKQRTRSEPVTRAADIHRAPPTATTVLPKPSSPRHVTTESSSSTVATAVTDSFASFGAQSDTSASSNASSQHSIVRGFTPGQSGVTSYRSKIQMAPQPQPQPILKKSAPATNNLTKKKSNGMFMLGCSSGSGASGEEEQSLSKSLLSRSLRSSGGSHHPGCEAKKQTSFKDEVAVMKPGAHEDAAVFDDSDEEEDTDTDASEGAIEEEDDDAWEDDSSEVQAQEPTKDGDMKFYRVDSAAHLPSRRSALTLNLAGHRNSNSFRATPAYKRSRTSTPNGPSMPGSPEQDSQLEMRARQMGTSKPIIPTTTNTQPLAPLTSPRTTRRNMMAGELSESLRKNMLSERQQRNPLQIDPNQIRRAQTSFDVPRMTRLTENGSMDSKDIPKQRQRPSFDDCFKTKVPDYHESGW